MPSPFIIPTTDSQSTEELQRKKLNLECSKLSIEAEHQHQENTLKLKKITLEIEHLNRSSWVNPGTIIPIVATLITLGFAQSQGIFETASKKLELQNIEIKLQNRELTILKSGLGEDIAHIKKERSQVEDDKKRLEGERRVINEKLSKSKTELDKFSGAAQAARNRAESAESKYKFTYPAFRKSLLDRFIINANITCIGGLAEIPTEIEYNNQEEDTLHINTPHQAFPYDISSCLTLQLSKATYLSELKTEESNLLIEKVKSAGKKLNSGRIDAIQAYSNENFSPSYRNKNNSINGLLLYLRKLDRPQYLYLSMKAHIVNRNKEEDITYRRPEKQKWTDKPKWADAKRMLEVRYEFFDWAYSIIESLADIPDK